MKNNNEIIHILSISSYFDKIPYLRITFDTPILYTIPYSKITLTEVAINRPVICSISSMDFDNVLIYNMLKPWFPQILHDVLKDDIMNIAEFVLKDAAFGYDEEGRIKLVQLNKSVYKEIMDKYLYKI